MIRICIMLVIQGFTPWIGLMNISIPKATLTKLLANGHLTLDAVNEISADSKKIWHRALLESLKYDRSENTDNKQYGLSDHERVSESEPGD